jgi:hypothetical protein
MPAGAVKVDRTTPYGNPFAVGKLLDQAFANAWWRAKMGPPPMVLTAQDAVDAFRKLAYSQFEAGALAEIARHDLRGKDLACWCALDAPCHADVLLEIANASESAHG